MISIVRSGPRILVAAPPEGAFSEWLLTRAVEVPDFTAAVDITDESSVIVLLADSLEGSLKAGEARRVMVARRPAEELLVDALNEGVTGLGKLRFAPRILFLRGIGDLGAVASRVENELGAFPGHFMELFDSETTGSIICVTGKPLAERIRLEDIYPIALYVPRSYSEIKEELRLKGLRWLNAGSGDKDWIDYEVKVYDRYEEYALQLERMTRVFNSLELGLVLGESWSTDSPRFMMRIDVYRLRILSFLSPERFKGIFLGLEYLDDGLRVGDYDIFRDERKVHWSDAKTGGLRDRKELGLHFRRELMGMLSEEVKEGLSELERKIRESRRD